MLVVVLMIENFVCRIWELVIIKAAASFPSILIVIHIILIVALTVTTIALVRERKQVRKFIAFGIEKRLAYEIASLRASSFFSAELAPENATDKFDEHSFFPTLRFENTLIGAGRITDTSKISVFNEWSKGKDTTPKGEHIYEFSRAAIKKEWRNKAMYHLLAALSLEYLMKIKAKRANCVLGSNIPLHKYILRLGSAKCGQPYICHDPPCIPEEVQAYTLDLTAIEFQGSHSKEKNKVMGIMNRMGYQTTLEE